MTERHDTLDSAALGELRKSVGDDSEFLAELVDDFLADGPAQLESLRLAASGGDAASARRAAHTLKGNSRTFGAGGLASLCQEAETAAAAGELGAVIDRVDAIDSEWGRVRTALLAVRDGYP